MDEHNRAVIATATLLNGQTVLVICVQCKSLIEISYGQIRSDKIIVITLSGVLHCIIIKLYTGVPVSILVPLPLHGSPSYLLTIHNDSLTCNF